MQQLDRKTASSYPWQKLLVAEVLGGSSLLEVSCKVCRRAFACSNLIRFLFLTCSCPGHQVLYGRSSWWKFFSRVFFFGKVCEGAFACSISIGKRCMFMSVAEVLGGSSLLEVSCKVCRRAFACSNLIRFFFLTCSCPGHQVLYGRSSWWKFFSRVLYFGKVCKGAFACSSSIGKRCMFMSVAEVVGGRSSWWKFFARGFL